MLLRHVGSVHLVITSRFPGFHCPATRTRLRLGLVDDEVDMAQRLFDEYKADVGDAGLEHHINYSSQLRHSY